MASRGMVGLVGGNMARSPVTVAGVKLTARLREEVTTPSAVNMAGLDGGYPSEAPHRRPEVKATTKAEEGKSATHSVVDAVGLDGGSMALSPTFMSGGEGDLLSGRCSEA